MSKEKKSPDYIKKGETLLKAIAEQNIEKVREALDNGADIDYISPYDITIFKGPPGFSQTQKGNTALHCAIKKESDEIFTLLLVRGANPNLILPSLKSTPLDAIKNLDQRSKIVKKMFDRLVEAGAKSYITIKEESYSDYTKNCEALLDAVKSQNVEKVREALDNGADIDYLSIKNPAEPRGALHYAIESGNEDIFTLLLVKGANPNLISIYGQYTPLDVASYKAEYSETGKKMIDRLLKAGAKYYTPLEKTILGKNFVEKACVDALTRGDTNAVLSYIELTSYSDYKLDLYKALADKAVEQQNPEILTAISKNLNNYKGDEFIIYKRILEQSLSIDTNLAMKVAAAGPTDITLFEKSPLFGVDPNGPNLPASDYYRSLTSSTLENLKVLSSRQNSNQASNIVLDTGNIALAGVVANQLLNTAIGKKIASTAREAVTAINGLWEDTSSKSKLDKKPKNKNLNSINR